MKRFASSRHMWSGSPMETGMWAARCRMIHPGGAGSVSSRKAAADEYAAKLLRTGRKDLSITERGYIGLPVRRRRSMLQQWEVAYPTPKKGPIYAWAARASAPAGPTKQERRANQKVEETERRTATPTAEPGHLRALRVTEKKRGRDGVPTVNARPAAPKDGGGETPPIRVGSHQLAPVLLGARRASAAAEPRGDGQGADAPAYAPTRRTPTPTPWVRKRPTPPQGRRTEASTPTGEKETGSRR